LEAKLKVLRARGKNVNMVIGVVPQLVPLAEKVLQEIDIFLFQHSSTTKSCMTPPAAFTRRAALTVYSFVASSNRPFSKFHSNWSMWDNAGHLEVISDGDESFILVGVGRGRL